MDYVVGSVAALVTGNVTPNRPKFLKRALTPTKHQPSPNVTPKSELADDRSIFLSPTLQKKKAVVKKSPKRIFENPDLDVTNDDEGSTKSKSPKAEKVKKHLKEDLDADLSPKSIKNKSPSIKDVQFQSTENEDMDISGSSQVENESTPKKKKKKQSLIIEPIDNINTSIDNIDEIKNKTISPKKNKKGKKKTIVETNVDAENNISHTNETQNNETEKSDTEENSTVIKQSKILNNIENLENPKKAKKKNKKQKKKLNNKTDNTNSMVTKNTLAESNISISKKNKNKTTVNPNAITDKDSDSEHDSDNEIDSEDEQNNKEVLDTGPADDSSEDEEEKPKKKEKVQKKEVVVNTEEEVKRTLFVGNVPFSPKCKKEIKKIFSKYGQIETVRIRTVPVKDGRATPKLAVIKNDLHPERSTVNVYVKFQDASSVREALAENGTVLNDHHLRVTFSDCTGSEHDPKCAIFVGNLPFALEDETLQQKFQQCGEIESVRIIRDSKTKVGKGFGYVNFKSKDAVELALQLPEEDLTIKNRILRVKRCMQTNTKQKPQQENRRGNFQGGRGRGNTRGVFDRGNTQGGFGRGNEQGGFGRGSMRGGFDRGNSRGGFGRGNTRGSFGRGNTRGGFGRGNMRGGFDRGNVQGREQFWNGDDKQVGRPAYNDSKADGAMRRLMKKRSNQDGADGPPNKMQKTINQPGKKQRKEFVGMTAEKKKKSKFDKGQKKKKALSEILTK
ncbi:nucleolar protein 12-like [Papilio machaon]|uniref:nucleolar protein 12-like n=1 Tax=Papilio machaon TaxID=76193 RepID=UPI001E66441F|nr:nucleolar protein 12-like [Papilio machaon]